MKFVADLFEDIPHRILSGSYETRIASIELDSRSVTANSLFIAVPGTQTDGHKYIADSINAGAIGVVCSVKPASFSDNVTYILVEDLAKYVGVIAANFYEHPSEKMKVVGVTGTNGKTSIVFLAAQVFSMLGFKTGMISTIQNWIGEEVVDATLTTPDPVNLQRLMAQMSVAGCEYVFMEVSSHAIHQHRISGLRFTGGVFTNITHDHLDYHHTFKNYIQVKKNFFDTLPETSFALTNIDDRNGSVMVQNSPAKRLTYALQKSADYKGKIIESQSTGLHLLIDGKEIFTPLVGGFNASNLLAVYGLGRQLGLDQLKLLACISKVKPPPGRLETIWNEQRKILAFVDYAHTPDALKKVLQTIQGLKNHDAQVITVLGCGGNRDRSKRPVMAKIAISLSDRVILTSDNPRDEDPSLILKQMMQGVPQEAFGQVLSIEDRREAIRAATMLASENSIILVAGKGHEKYQEILGKRYPFDDREEIQHCFNLN